MVGNAYDHAYWFALDRTLVHMIHAMAFYGKNNLVFKGGTHLRVCVLEGDDPAHFRYSEDLDFEWDGYRESFGTVLRKALDRASTTSGNELELGSGRYYGFAWRTSEPPLREGHVDVDYRVRGPAETDLFAVRNLYGDSTLGNQWVRGFTALSVAIDKVSAVLSPTRVATRDVYDLWWLLRYDYVDPEAVWQGFSKRYAPQGIDVARDTLLDFISEVIKCYREDWDISSRKNIYPSDLSSFDQFQDMALDTVMRMGDT